MKVFCQIKRVALSVLYVFFFGSTVSLTLFGAKLDLSDQQEAYRKSNPVIRIGIMEAWPPMGFMDSTGKAIGISADLLEHLSRITGFNFEMVSGPFFELFEMVKHGEIDALMDTTPTSERMDHLLFTRPYLTIPHVIVGRRDSPVYGSLDDLSHARIALEKGFYLIPLLRNLYPDISILEMPSTLQALEAVSMEMADVYIGNRAAVFYLMVQHLLANLKVHSQIDPEGSVNAIAVNKDHPHLASILDQALGLVPAEEWFAVLRKWTEGLEEQQDQFMLTLEERIWLENHRPIRIGIMDQWPPMNFVDAQGNPSGIGVDFLNALNLRMRGVFEIHPGVFAENMRKVHTGELDGLMDITPTQEREEHFHFTRTYLDIPHVIVAQRDGVFFHDEADLYGKVLALERGYGNVAYFRENHPQVTVREYDSTSLCLDAVSKGEADAYAGNRAVASFIIEQELITNLQIQGRLSKEGSLLSFGIRKDWPELVQIIDRALSSIGIEEIRAIHRRWTGFDDIQADLQSSLTGQEISWLSQHSSLSIGFSSQWPPFEFLDEQGQPAGVVSDYISWIGNQLGIEFTIVQEASWDQLLRKVQYGEIDVLPAVVPTEQRQDFLAFTRPYLNLPLMIITRSDADYIDSLEMLRGKSIAVVQNHVVEEYLKQDFPEIELMGFGSSEAVLKAVSEGRAFAAVENGAVFSYYIAKLGIRNLKMAASTRYSYDLVFAVNIGQTELSGILDKALSAIPDREKSIFFERWINIQFARHTDWAVVLRIVAIVIAVSLLIVGWFLWWNRKLAVEIAERKKVETALRESEQQQRLAKDIAEKATQVKSDFLARMSHEIRTPMNAIIGLNYLALQTQLTPKQHDYLTKIQSAAHSLLGIIDDILDYSKIESGKIEIESIPFSLDDVLDQLSNIVSMRAEEKGIEILFDIDPDLPYDLVGDPLRLGQILINLVNNAIKFTDSGEVLIRIKALEKMDESVSVRFEVQDTGIGLSEEQIGKLFKSFSQADGTHTRKYGGSGLGLAICKRLVEMMDGEIGVESRPKEGSTFFFDLRLGISDRSKTYAFVPSVDLRGLRTMVVDDNATAREILSAALASFSFDVTTVASGPEAIAELINAAQKGKPYQLVLMDWKMPGMDGLETIGRMKTEQALSTIPKILMVTAYGREEVVGKAHEYGLSACLTKPVNHSMLFNTIMDVFGQDRVSSTQSSSLAMHIPKGSESIRGASVLLVEDNEINQQIASELLKSVGLIVESVENGIEAVRCVKEKDYDLILMDIQMPKMDGFAATRAIRALNTPWASVIPIVAMTAHAMSGDRELSLEAGMDDHITKPIDPDQLLKTLTKWIKLKPTQSITTIPQKPVDHERKLWEETLPLSGLPGIDVRSGLLKVAGNLALYQKLLMQFKDKYLNTAVKVQSLLTAGKQSEALRYLHTVKGLSGNLGLKAVFQAVSEVERLLKEKDFDYQKLDQSLAFLDEQMEVVHGSLEKQGTRQTQSLSDPSHGSSQQVETVIREIILNLDRDRDLAKEGLKQLRSIFPSGEMGAHTQKAYTLFDDFDTDEAREVLEMLSNALKREGKEE